MWGLWERVSPAEARALCFFRRPFRSGSREDPCRRSAPATPGTQDLSSCARHSPLHASHVAFGISSESSIISGGPELRASLLCIYLITARGGTRSSGHSQLSQSPGVATLWCSASVVVNKCWAPALSSKGLTVPVTRLSFHSEWL